MPISKEDDKSSWEPFTQYFFHTLSCTEFDPWLIKMKAWW